MRYGAEALSFGAGVLAVTIIAINLQPAIYQALIGLTP